MVNYKLEEFKEWLEADESRAATKPLTSALWETTLRKLKEDNCFDYLIEKKDFNVHHNFATNSKGWEPYRKVVLRWIQERERERAKPRRNHA